MPNRYIKGFHPPQQACPNCGSTTWETLGTCDVATMFGACCDPWCSDCGMVLAKGKGVCGYHTQELPQALLSACNPEIATQEEAMEWALYAQSNCSLIEARAAVKRDRRIN